MSRRPTCPPSGKSSRLSYRVVCSRIGQGGTARLFQAVKYESCTPAARHNVKISKEDEKTYMTVLVDMVTKYCDIASLLNESKDVDISSLFEGEIKPALKEGHAKCLKDLGITKADSDRMRPVISTLQLGKQTLYVLCFGYGQRFTTDGQIVAQKMAYNMGQDLDDLVTEYSKAIETSDSSNKQRLENILSAILKGEGDIDLKLDGSQVLLCVFLFEGGAMAHGGHPVLRAC